MRLQSVNGKYFAVWNQDGKRHRRSLGTDNATVARLKLVEFQRVHAELSKTLAKPTETTVEAVWCAYLSDRRAQSKPAVERMEYAWMKLSPVFAHLGATMVTAEDCRAYRLARLEKVKDGTIHVELGYLRAALEWGALNKKIAAAPYIPLPAKPPPKDHYLTRPQFKELLDAVVMPHVRLALILLLSTAARVGAVTDLTWDRVDFERRKIVLLPEGRSQTAKGRATVPMNDMAYEALQEARSGALSPFVVEWGGCKVGSLKKGVGAAGRRIGVKVSPHVLRHTAAVWMAEGGVPMEEIAAYLGHTNVATTRRIYARYSPDHLRSAANLLTL